MARTELDEARGLVQTGLNYDFDKWHWRDWAFTRLLLDEANGLIPQPSSSADQMACRLNDRLVLGEGAGGLHLWPKRHLCGRWCNQPPIERSC